MRARSEEKQHALDDQNVSCNGADTRQRTAEALAKAVKIRVEYAFSFNFCCHVRTFSLKTKPPCQTPHPHQAVQEA
eukprot:6187703-Amphidinium_carterae.1